MFKDDRERNPVGSDSYQNRHCVVILRQILRFSICGTSLYEFSSFHTVVLLSLIFLMTVKHNYLFINLLFLLITGCLYDYDTTTGC